ATALFDKLPVPEIQLYLGRQVFEEGLHSHSYQFCIEGLGLDQGEIYNRYRTVPEIYQKLILAQQYTDSLTADDFDMQDPEYQRRFVKALVFYGIGFEGVWFYNGFTPVFSLQRRGLMKATGEQFQYILRDEANHATFYQWLIQMIRKEYPHIWIPGFDEELRVVLRQVVEAEKLYIGYILKSPILAYSPRQHIDQAKFMVNLRAQRIGLGIVYPEITRPATPWLDEQAFIKKEKNFFESRVNEYQNAGRLNWD
ncbi:MAG: ribonucleotide-diphosphate reductase subunit beta, partial [Candidatus Bathyarchaeota archaeon]